MDVTHLMMCSSARIFIGGIYIGTIKQLFPLMSGYSVWERMLQLRRLELCVNYYDIVALFEVLNEV